MLDDLALGPGNPVTIRALQSAELSKHLLLLVAVDSITKRSCPREHKAAGMDSAFALLTKVQEKLPGVAAEILALPQVGAWALSCLERAEEETAGAPERTGSFPLRVDLGYLNAVAASAALRAGLPFELVVPLRHGRLVLPHIGMADVGLTQAAQKQRWDTARIRSARQLPVTETSPIEPPVEILMTDGTERPYPACWIPVHRLRAEACGLVLDVALDNQDPFLDRYGHPVAATQTPRAADAAAAAWTALIAHAWQLLAGHHRDYATAIAAGLRSIVPLSSEQSENRIAAVSCLAFGAVGIGLPRAADTLAESLVHEFQHLKLGAAADIDDFFIPGPSMLVYAPWRDDPRPCEALLQGVYAYVGVTGFWRTERLFVRPGRKLAGNIEFARWRSATLYAARTLAGSGRLSRSGHRFVGGLITTLRGWQGDPVPAQSLRIAQEMLTAHHLDWRACHLRPSIAAVDQLALSWENGSDPADDGDIRITARGDDPPTGARIRRQMTELRYRDPERFLRSQHDSRLPGAISGLDAADTALVHGDDEAAEAGYRLRIAADGRDPGAWSGLALIAWRRASQAPGWSAVRTALRPELSCALYLRLRESTGQVTDPGSLIAWTARRGTRRAPRTAGQLPVARP